jgi:CDP-glucose 4,6-dehydratase
MPFHEASLLKLNCDKALFHLKWEANLEYAETISLVGDWYAAYYRKISNMYEMTLNQIAAYEQMGIERSRAWTR